MPNLLTDRTQGGYTSISFGKTEDDLATANTMSVVQAAARLQVSRDTIHQSIKAGQLTAWKKTPKINSGYLIDTASVEAFDQLRRAQTQSTTPSSGARLGSGEAGAPGA